MDASRRKPITVVGERHIASIRAWQQANGGFRRLPPRAADVQLSNWVQFCRTQYRRGALDPDTSTALLELGIPLEAVTKGIQPSPAFYEKAHASITRLRALNAENDRSEGAAWRHDADLMEWLNAMCELSARRPSLAVWSDIKRLVPNVYAATIGKTIGLKELPPSNPRGTDVLLEMIIGFYDTNHRLPSFIAQTVEERQLASWLIRLERDLVGVNAYSQKRFEKQEGLVRVLVRQVRTESMVQRMAEWHWWSLCALHTLKEPAVGSRWHHAMYAKSLPAWIKTLGRDPRTEWVEQAQRDADQGLVAQRETVKIAIDATRDADARGYRAPARLYWENLAMPWDRMEDPPERTTRRPAAR